MAYRLEGLDPIGHDLEHRQQWHGEECPGYSPKRVPEEQRHDDDHWIQGEAPRQQHGRDELALGDMDQRVEESNSEFSRPVRIRIACVSLVTAMIYCVGVFVVFFVTETPIGATRIYGLQGRYFVVVVPVAATTVSALLNRSLGRGRSLVAITSSLVSVAAMAEALWRVHWATEPTTGVQNGL